MLGGGLELRRYARPRLDHLGGETGLGPALADGLESKNLSTPLRTRKAVCPNRDDVRWC